MTRVGDCSRGKIAGVDSCLCEGTGSVGKIRGNSKWAHHSCNGLLSYAPITIPTLDGCGKDIRSVEKVTGMIKLTCRLRCRGQNCILFFLLVLIRPPNLWELRFRSCRSDEDPVVWLLMWKEKDCTAKQEVSSQPAQMLVGFLSSLWSNWRYMEKSLSYSALVSLCDSDNRQRKSINLVKTSKSSWGLRSLGRSVLCYKSTLGAPPRGQICPGVLTYLPIGTGRALVCKSSFHQQSTWVPGHKAWAKNFSN